MFLRDLDDKYKKPFLNLAYTIMSADGEFAEKEKVMLGIYKHDLGMESYKVNIDPKASLIFKVLDRERKAEIYYELLRVVYADSEYSEEEAVILNRVQSEWQLSDEIDKEMREIVVKINIAYAQLYVLLSEI